ncbi:sensor histidine kinase [Lacisediminihabitans changchengi]|uniref:histidine kinase n=1 Tax=Lacisediminihabitans changchengi TaxID=2787634 RepID=A0A934W363_9MICO|nr:PAS domain-containing sensor histidine kinase [Lacisediminihabitans changchengi]MBK4346864.1 PAS domain-containing protein [Lacisediminihabitans changchengi]MBK4348013.1 PAS domain-containing protein [Lacisediminihabitans changchengi]
MRLRRSVVQSQLLVAASMLVLACLAIALDSEALESPIFLCGLGVEFVATTYALLIPWSEKIARFATVLPIVNIVAIVLVREGRPELGAGLLLVLPIMWMARHNGLAGTIGGVGFATVLLWGGTALTGLPTIGSAYVVLLLLPMTLAFVATATHATARRNISQRILLQQQAQLVERAYARARKQELFRNEVLDAVSFGVLAFDREGNLTLMNEAHRLSLATFHTPAGSIVHPVAYRSDRVTAFSSEERPMGRALRGESFDDETIWVGEPGSRRAAYAVTSRPLSTPDGEYDGQVVVVRDITRELDAVEARDDLVASVSHDLRTPITSILGYLELVLEDDGIDEKNRKMVGIAHRNSERLLALVSDLMHVASQADARAPMTFQPYDVGYTVDEAVESQRPMIEGQGLRLEADIDDQAMCVVDPLRMRQVLDNLLTNAVKYNRPGGVVRVTLRDDGEFVRIAVSDTGVGISETDQKRLFERYFRAESARQSSVHGSGLGLNITAEIIAEHGGELLVSSEPGVGSRFEIVLPSLGSATSVVGPGTVMGAP